MRGCGKKTRNRRIYIHTYNTQGPPSDKEEFLDYQNFSFSPVSVPFTDLFLFHAVPVLFSFFFLWQRKTRKLPSVGSRPERGNFHEKMPEAALDAKQSASNSRSSDSPLASPLFAYTYVLTNSFCSFFRPGLLLELVFRGKLVAYFLQHRQEK